MNYIKQLSNSIILCFIASVSNCQPFTKAITIVSQNDSYLFTGQDRYYTGGLLIKFDKRIKATNKYIKTTRWELGQLIFTPYSGFAPVQELHDRPFAGALFLKKTNTYSFSARKILSVSAMTGVIGPASYAQQTQIKLHKLLHFYQPAGWEYQIKNEPGIGIGADYSWLLASDVKFDISVTHSLNLSNIFSNVGTSIMFRVGKLAPGFLNTRFFNPVLSTKKVLSECFLFIEMGEKYILYDATIDGLLFTKNGSTNFQIVPFIFSVNPGIFYCKNRWAVSYSAIFSTREVKKSVYAAHQFGSISLIYHFPSYLNHSINK